MKDGDDRYALGFDEVEHTVREPTEERAPHLAVSQ